MYYMWSHILYIYYQYTCTRYSGTHTYMSSINYNKFFLKDRLFSCTQVVQ